VDSGGIDVRKQIYIIGIVFLLGLSGLSTITITTADEDCEDYNLGMNIDESWNEYASKCIGDNSIKYDDYNFDYSFSLLDMIEYTPEERNQSPCGTCWAWASTGISEIALNNQEGIKDRLSIQPIQYCGDGLPEHFSAIYEQEGAFIPWSNDNADWHGEFVTNYATEPKYPIESIQDRPLPTIGVSQENAIQTIKNELVQNKGVYFAFILPTYDAWDDFEEFWHEQPESSVFDFDDYANKLYDSGIDGHAVLIVGWEGDDWIMLNSWGKGNSGLRVNCLFKADMNINYSSLCYGIPNYYSYIIATFDIVFDIEEQYSKYDVNQDGDVDYQDAGLVWIHRTSIVPYDPLYDVNNDGTVNFQDAGIVWIHRD
jgi:hypothetical protein